VCSIIYRVRDSVSRENGSIDAAAAADCWWCSWLVLWWEVEGDGGGRDGAAMRQTNLTIRKSRIARVESTVPKIQRIT
jgi:hypothetical protein